MSVLWPEAYTRMGAPQCASRIEATSLRLPWLAANSRITQCNACRGMSPVSGRRQSLAFVRLKGSVVETGLRLGDAESVSDRTPPGQGSTRPRRQSLND